MSYRFTDDNGGPLEVGGPVELVGWREVSPDAEVEPLTTRQALGRIAKLHDPDMDSGRVDVAFFDGVTDTFLCTTSWRWSAEHLVCDAVQVTRLPPRRARLWWAIRRYFGL